MEILIGILKLAGHEDTLIMGKQSPLNYIGSNKEVVIREELHVLMGMGLTGIHLSLS